MEVGDEAKGKANAKDILVCEDEGVPEEERLRNASVMMMKGR